MRRGRSRAVVVLLVALVIVAVTGLCAVQALALPAYEHDGATTCGACHTSSSPSASNASSDKCIGCHTGFALRTSSDTCWTCHNPGQDMSGIVSGSPTTCTGTCHLGGVDTGAVVPGTPHTMPTPPAGNCTQSGCHDAWSTPTSANGDPHHTAASPPPAATIAIDTVTPKLAKVRSAVTLSGGVTPIDTAATSVAWVVQFKKGSKWVQMKAGTATLGFLGGAMRFSFTYTPMKKGNYRAQASFFNLIGGSKTTSKWVMFKAK